MDELGGLIGGLVGVIAVIYAVVWLIGVVVTLLAIAVMIAIGVAAVAGPPIGLGALLRKLLARRYTLSRRKKWQCAGVTALAFALPCLTLLIDTSTESQLAVAWAATVLSLSSAATFLTISAYRQHFAEHRHAIRHACATFREKERWYRRTTRKVGRLEATIGRAERKHGQLLQAQEALNAQMEALVENSDPALCRIKIGHWEHQYSTLPPKGLADELSVVARELAGVPEAHRGTLKLRSLFLESQLLRRKLAKHSSASRFQELKAERAELQEVVASCTRSMTECERIQSERTAKIAQLKHQRLLIQ